MKKILVLLMIVVALAASACTEFTPPGVCQNSPSSILQITNGNPTGLDRSLLLINVVGLESNKYTADQASEFITETKNMVESGVSYIDLLGYLNAGTKNVNTKAGLALIVLGPDVPAIANLGGESLINDCDQALIVNHLNKQLLILGAYK